MVAEKQAKRPPSGAVLKRMADKLRGEGVTDRLRAIAVLSRYATEDEGMRRALTLEKQVLVELCRIDADAMESSATDQLVEELRATRALYEVQQDSALRKSMAEEIGYPPGEGPSTH